MAHSTSPHTHTTHLHTLLQNHQIISNSTHNQHQTRKRNVNTNFHANTRGSTGVTTFTTALQHSHLHSTLRTNRTRQNLQLRRRHILLINRKHTNRNMDSPSTTHNTIYRLVQKIQTQHSTTKNQHHILYT